MKNGMTRLNLSALTRGREIESAKYASTSVDSIHEHLEEGDRLSMLGQTFQLRKLIVASLETLSPLENPELAGQCTSEDLEEINVHLRDAAKDLKKMLEYFLSKAKKETEENPLAF